MRMLADKPLVSFAARALSGCQKIAVIGDSVAAEWINAIPLTDSDHVSSGPLAGIMAALIWADTLACEYLVTIPCDTPFLPENCAQQLVEAARVQGREVVCVASDRGMEPLVAAWHVKSALPILRHKLASGEHPAVYALMRELGAGTIELSAHHATNINTLDALARAQAWLKAQKL